MVAKIFQYINHLFLFFLNHVRPFLFITKGIDLEIKCFPLFLSPNNHYLLLLHFARFIPAAYTRVIVQLQLGAKCPTAEMTAPLKWHFPRPLLPLIMSQPGGKFVSHYNRALYQAWCIIRCEELQLVLSLQDLSAPCLHLSHYFYFYSNDFASLSLSLI